MRSSARYLLLPALFCCALLAGCVEEEITFNINKDGSGTVVVSMKGDDRVLVLLEELKSSPNSDPSFEAGLDLLAVPNVEALEAMLPEGIAIEQFHHEETANAITKQLTLSWTDPALLRTAFVQKTLHLEPRVSSDGTGEIRIDVLTNIKEKPDFKLPTQPSPTISQMYALVKGYRQNVVVNFPGPLESESAQLTADGRQATWTVDLTNREGLEVTRSLLRPIAETGARAKFDPTGLDAIAREAWSVPDPYAQTSGDAEQDGRFACTIEVRELLLRSDRNGAGQMNQLVLEWSVDCKVDGENTIKPLYIFPAQLGDVRNRAGESILSHFEAKEDWTNELLILHYTQEGPLPEIASITLTQEIMAPGAVTSHSIPVAELRASKDGAPIPALEQFRIASGRVMKNSLGFVYSKVNDKLIRRIQSVHVNSGGSETKAQGPLWSGSSDEGTERWHFSELPEDGVITIEVANDGPIVVTSCTFNVPNL